MKRLLMYLATGWMLSSPVMATTLAEVEPQHFVGLWHARSIGGGPGCRVRFETDSVPDDASRDHGRYNSRRLSADQSCLKRMGLSIEFMSETREPESRVPAQTVNGTVGPVDYWRPDQYAVYIGNYAANRETWLVRESDVLYQVALAIRSPHPDIYLARDGYQSDAAIQPFAEANEREEATRRMRALAWRVLKWTLSLVAIGVVVVVLLRSSRSNPQRSSNDSL